MPTDGLPGIAIHRIVRDSLGFLWFGTGEGLSRFDGYEFKNYGVADGLRELNVYDVTETSEGLYWIATRGGLYRLQLGNGSPLTATKFRLILPALQQPANSINVVAEDTHRIWVGTDEGLLRGELSSKRTAGSRDQQWQFKEVALGMPDDRPFGRKVAAIRRDRKGQCWIGTYSGLYVLKPGGQVLHFTRKDGLPGEEVFSLLEDSTGQIWAGTHGGLARLASDVTAGGPIVLNSYTHRNGLPADDVKALLETSKGLIWVGTAGGLALFARNPDGRWLAIRSYTAPHGLIDANINSLAEDPHGNVWVGTDRGGAFKIPANGFVSYGSEDGFKSTHVTGMFEDRDGRLCIATRAPGRLFLNRFDGRRFTPVSLNVPARFYGTEWLGWYQVVLESRRRQWWAASVDGLLRFAGTGAGGNPRRMTLARRYDVRDGLAYNHVHQVFEDSGGRSG